MNRAASLDLFRHSPAALAAAHRQAAEIARIDPHYPSAEQRERRARYFEEQAERFEQQVQEARSHG